MPVPKAKKIYKLGSPYRIGAYERLLLPTWIRKIWPVNIWVIRVFALILALVYIGILLVMYGYEPKSLLLNYSRKLFVGNFRDRTSKEQFNRDPQTSDSYSNQRYLPAVGGIEINTNKKRNIEITLVPGGYNLKPGRFTIVPAGFYTLQIKGNRILDISKNIYIGKSVVYKDYFYIINDPVELQSFIRLKGNFFVKQIGEKILACNSDYLLIFTPGLSRYLDIVNYHIYSVVASKGNIKTLCNNVRRAQLIFINSPDSISLASLTYGQHVKNDEGKVQVFRFFKYSFSSLTKKSFEVSTAIKEAYTNISVQTSSSFNVPQAYKLASAGDMILAYPSGFRLNQDSFVFLWNKKDGRLVDKKVFPHFYGKIGMLKDTLYIFSIKPNIGKGKINLIIHLFKNGYLKKPVQTYILSVPYQIIYDVGFVGNLEHLYLLNSQGNLLVFTTKKFPLQDNNLKQYLQQQILLAQKAGLLKPFIYSLSKHFIKLAFQGTGEVRLSWPGGIYNFRLSQEDLSYLEEHPRNVFNVIRNIQGGGNCAILLDDKIICPETDNITSLMPGVYKIDKRALEIGKNKTRPQISIFSNTILFFYTNRLDLPNIKRGELVSVAKRGLSAYRISNIYIRYLGLNKLYPLNIVIDKSDLVEDMGLVRDSHFLGFTRHNINFSIQTRALNSKAENYRGHRGHVDGSEFTLLLSGKL